MNKKLLALAIGAAVAMPVVALAEGRHFTVNWMFR